jgi:hypothetical protein
MLFKLGLYKSVVEFTSWQFYIIVYNKLNFWN